MDFTVVILPAEEGGYWAEVPALPGCYAQGETLEETLRNAKDAVESHLTALREDGEDAGSDDGLLIGRVTVGI